MADNRCFDFLKGRCQRGDRCRFSHDLSSRGDEQVPLPDNRCFDFLKGRCQRGDRCRFSHDLPSRGDAQAGSSGEQHPTQPLEPFTCSGCGIEVKYEYFGRTPPFEPKIVFLEDAFVRRDPFATRARPMFVGGVCSLCGALVCAGSTCSVYYAKRFCLPCVQAHAHVFPPEVARELNKAAAS